MGLIREPEEVDFIVESRSLDDNEKQEISAIIAHYKKTGEIKKLKTRKRIPKSKKKEKA